MRLLARLTRTEHRLTEAVRRGAVLLDEHQPRWFDRVDLTDLLVIDPSRCVLSQVFGSYHGGRLTLGLPSVSTNDAPGPSYYGFANCGVEHLWREEVVSRRLADASVEDRVLERLKLGPAS